MKNLKLRWLFYFVLLGLCLQAQVNNQFKLQLYLADQNGSIYVNRTIGLKISILKSENEFPLYSERQVLTSDATGLLNIPIGLGTNRVGNVATFTQLTAGFIKIEYDPSGGSNYTRMLLQPLVSVPYANISNYALGLKGRGITGNHFADSSILAENLDFNPAKKEDIEVLKSWIDIYTNGSIPTLITYSSSPNAIDTAQISAIVSSDGGDSISEKGFVYSLSPNPTINNLRLKTGRGNANFSGVLKGLNASSTYHVRSYAMNRLGIGYGNPITITTASPLVIPTITTTPSSSILTTSAITGGNVTSDGGAAVTERGIVYATSGIPSLSSSKVVAGTSGTGTFTVNLTGLTGSTKYYFRAYATNSAGTGYSTLDSFVTLTPIVIPTIITTSADSILETSAITGGNVTSDGGATVTERGVVYATSGIPSITDNKVVANTAGIDTFTVNLIGLTGSTKYFFRAYATNSAGTGYGTLDSFTTLTPIVIPTVNTTSADSILETSATTGGNVISDGGAAITERGVVYSTSGIPSLVNSKVVAGTSGTGTYTVNLTGLTASTKYFFRAYATNSAGTGYGSLDSLTTLTPIVIPTVNTTSADSILETSAITGGNVTSDGGAAITERGVVYSTAGLPSITDNKVVAGTSGTGTFTVNLTGLTGSTTYFFRAYATNSAGTAYGTLDSFVTLPPIVIPTIITTSADSILETSAITGGNVTSDGGAAITERGVVYTTTGLPSITDNKVVANTAGIDTFTVNLTGLTGSTTYFFRAYATNSAGTGYGSLDSFTTLTPIVIPTVNTTSADSILETSAITGGNVTSDGGAAITERGVVYATSGLPSITDNKVVAGTSGTGTFTVNLTGLTGSTTYFFRAYATNSAGTGYGTLDSFVTLTPIVIPTIITTSADSIFETSAITGGNVISDGGAAIDERGVVYSTSGLPSITDNKVVADTVGIDTFTVNLTGLTGSTTYFFRAYATNSAGTGYGTLDSFVTLPPIVIPTITTTSADSILETSAITGGNVTSDGGAAITERGVVYTTSGLPSITDNKVVANTVGIDTFTVNLTGLTGSTTYFFRAYATNSAGTGYGSLDSFTTLTPIVIPTVNTTSADSILETSANTGGNVISDGGAAIAERGVVYTTSGLPSITDNKVVANTVGIDTFTVNLTGLTGSTTYFFRAYATNSAGTGYGSLDSFTTLTPIVIPTIITTSADSILETSAITGGKVTSDGGAAITERGVVYATSGLPSITDNKVVADTSGIGTFTVNLTGLTGSTTYFFRAYATNSAGTGYGSLDSFTTLTPVVLPTISTTSLSGITTSSATTGGNVTSDGGAAVSERGVVWDTSSMPTITLSTKTSNGLGTGSFTSEITGIAPNTIYYVRAYATNSAGTAYGNELTFNAIQGVPCSDNSTVTDIDGNTYNTVQIGTQCWTKENLRVTKYSDGTIIPLDSSGGTSGDNTGHSWGFMTSGTRTLFEHSQDNFLTYGYLYNWYAAKGIATSGNTSYKNLCPIGWHVPTDGEWNTLTTFLGGQNIAGGKMKSSGTTFWRSPNTDATDESGFTGLPGGERLEDGRFVYLGSIIGAWWSASENSYSNASLRRLEYDNGTIGWNGYPKEFGISVRCLMDNNTTSTTTLPNLNTIVLSNINTSVATSGVNISADGGCAITSLGVVWSTSPNPDISLATKTSDGTGTGIFISNLTNLKANTTYYLRAYATNCVGTGYGDEISFITTGASMPESCPGLPSITDIDGNIYNTVQIGTQCWTKENLKATKYNDGTLIPIDSSGTAVNGDLTWFRRNSGARTIYAHSQSNFSTYGYLYNWYAVKGIDTTGSTSYKNICPTGWHVPTDEEWDTLTTFLGGRKMAGGKMKSTGTTLWNSPNIDATNGSGFTGLPGGYRDVFGSFKDIKSGFFFWSASESGSGPWFRYLHNNNSFVYRIYYYDKNVGASVRCLRDTGSVTTAMIPTLTTTTASSILATSAVTGGSVTSDGGAAITERGVVYATSGLPSITDNKVVADSTSTDTFTVNLTGLSSATTYYFRAYATNSVGTGFGAIDSMTTLLNYCPSDTIMDIDGNVYNTVSIGSQCWTKENLRVTRYKDGTLIPIDTTGGTSGNGSGQTWSNLTTGARSVYGNDANNLSSYGYLYNWYAASNSKGLCPTGWHVPVDNDIWKLTSDLGHSIAGVRLMSNIGWSSLSNATNDSGFSGLPGGMRFYSDGSYYFLNTNGYFWSSTEYSLDTSTGFGFQLFIADSVATWNAINSTKSFGYSVRCLRDTGSVTTAMIPTLTTTSASSILATSAVTGGSVTSDGGAAITERGVVYSTSGLPSITDNKVVADSTSTDTFTVNLTGLSSATTYYFRAYATNSVGTGYGSLDSMTTLLNYCPSDTIMDIDGNVYNTVSIGSQCWTKENLRVTRYKDGTSIPTGLNDATWFNTSTGAYAIYDNDPANEAIYGNLYNGYAVADSKKLCPTGWHVPNDAEWTTLTTNLGGGNIAGGKMKSVGTTLWTAPNTGATNESGFTGLPGGYRNAGGGFYSIGDNAYFWSVTVNNDNISALGRALDKNDGYVYNSIAPIGQGNSVRCLRDTGSVTTAMIPTLTTTSASSIFATSAVTGGSVTSDGGAAITERGVVYSTSGLPSITDNKVVAGTSGPGTYTVNLTGLTGSTKYYFRAYATNSAGTGYGTLDSFVTLTPVVLPTISTTSLSGITTSSATTGGNVTSDGGATVSERGVVWATSSMPTITLSTKTIDGTGTGNFTSAITGIVPNTIYYVRAYATNSAGTVYGNELTFNAVQGVSCPGFSTVTDIDGNIYNTVQIGTQCWTKENLRVTKYSDGTIIPLDSSGGTSGDNTGHTWGFLTSGLHTLNSHSQSNLATYGYLYNWYAAKGIATSGNTSYKNLCPTGWHVPADGEWNTLTTFLGGQNIAGGKMKSTGTTLWASPNTGATNESGFTGLPGGYRLEDGRFIPGQGSGTGAWWSTSEFSSSGGCRFLEYNNGNLRDNGYPKEFGFSVRCLMDNNNSTSTTSLPTINTNVISNINLSTAVSGGNIMSDGGCTITERGVVWSTSQNPTIALSTKTSTGTGTGSFTSNLTGLTANTTYFVRAYATNCVGTGYGDEISFITTGTSMPESCPGLPNITDIDGNIYNTVQIGTQCWTKENLKVTKYNDGTLIPLDSSGGTTGNGDLTWFRRTSGARTIYAHSQSNFSTYGYLYNWYAVKGIDTTGSTSYKNLCPTGWHVPTDEEWDTLTTFLGGRTIAGGKMKSTGTTLWNSPNIDATNGSGFTGLPGGYRNVFGNFNDVNSGFFFWSASESGSGPWFRYLHNSNSFVYRIYYQFKNVGASVRCLRDTASVTTAMIPTLTTTPASSILATSAVTGGSVTSDGGASITERGVVYATSGLPSLLNSKVVAGTSGTGTYTVNLTGLTGSTKYYFRAYATNSAGTGYGSLDSMTTLSNYCPTNTITDIDGNVYNTLSIGSQCWTKENLRVTKYRDGTSIPTGLNDATWLNTSTGAYAIYNNDPSNEAIYGKLYNWYAVVDPRALCPSGWHVPSDTEWTTLSDNLGGNIAGGKMKSTGTTLWTSPNTGATNQSGFTGLPGGFRNGGGGFYSIGDNAYFWSVTVNLGRALDKNDEFVYISNAPIGQGNSVRCLRDTASITTAMIPTLTTTPSSSILSSSAITGGSVTSDGGASVTERGVVYATSGLPSLLNSKVVAGTSGTGTYTVNLTGLTGSTKYFFRAFATNSAGTGYGTLDSFVTLTPVVLPTLTTTSLSGITTNSATTGGNVTSDGGATVSERGVVWATSSMPTITLSTKTIDGTGTGSFSSAITGIAPNTIYYVRAYATNSAGTVYGNELTFNAIQGVSCPGFSTVTDIDGNTYNTVQIGEQCWTKENLRVTKYSDGTNIPLDSSGGTAGNGVGQTWGSRTTGARTIYEHSASNLTTYGYLYNWYAAKGIDSSVSTSYKNLCPTGWHVPSDGEWTALTTYLGGENVAGGKMKSTGTTLWTFPNEGATNESGFTVLPGGFRSFAGYFNDIRFHALFWSATEGGSNIAWNLFLSGFNGNVGRYNDGKESGLSVRCLKD